MKTSITVKQNLINLVSCSRNSQRKYHQLCSQHTTQQSVRWWDTRLNQKGTSHSAYHDNCSRLMPSYEQCGVNMAGSVPTYEIWKIYPKCTDVDIQSIYRSGQLLPGWSNLSIICHNPCRKSAQIARSFLKLTIRYHLISALIAPATDWKCRAINRELGLNRCKKIWVYPSVPVNSQPWTARCGDHRDPQLVKRSSEWVSNSSNHDDESYPVGEFLRPDVGR